MFKFVLIAALVACASAFELSSCGANIPMPKNVAVTDCPREPCVLYLGDEFSFVVTVTLGAGVTSLPVEAFLVSEGQDDQILPLPSNDACDYINGGCRGVAGDHDIVFDADSSVLSRGTITARVNIKDQSENVVACGVVSFVIN